MGLIESLREESTHLTGFDKTLMDGLIDEYAALATMSEGLRKQILREGVMVQKEVGSVNNRHMETVENPAFTTYQKALARQGDLAKKLSDFNKRSDDKPAEDPNDLMAWNRAH